MRYVYLLVMISALSACATTGNSPTQAEIERISPEELAQLIPPATATVTLEELIAESKQGKTADELIAKIKTSQSRYDLTPSQILVLSKQGLDVKVLDYIQQSNELAKQNAIADEMNKRAIERGESVEQLRRERDLARLRYFDPFWGPGFGMYYGRPWLGPIGPGPRLWRGNRFGWGMGFGHPFWGW